MNNKNYILLFDFGHGTRKYTKGKHSPDCTIYEGEWVREVGKRLVQELQLMGFDCRIIVPEDQDIPLAERCERVNKIVKENPKSECLFISLHLNAAGDDGKWYNARGCTVWVCKKASEKSKTLAELYFDTAKEMGLLGNRKAEGPCEANFKVLKSTNCPAILTENMFQDNKKDVEWLLSETGKDTIINLHIITICKYTETPYGFIQE